MVENTFQVNIRQADIADIEDLIVLLKVLFSIEEDFVFDEQKQRDGLQLILNNKNACVLVAELEGQVIGMCSGQLTISTAEGGPALLVEDVVVQQEYRYRGIARQLMDAVAKWGESKGASRLQLLADKHNEQGFDFYEKIGWQKTQLICLRKKIV